MGTVFNVFGRIVGTVIILMTLQVVADVLLRATTNRGLPGTIEISQYWWMVCIAWLGLSLAQHRGEHISAPLVFDHMTEFGQRVWTIFARVLTGVVGVLLGYYGLRAAMEAMDLGVAGSTTGLPLWPVYFAIPLGAVLLVIALVSPGEVTLDEDGLLDQEELTP